MKNTLKIGCICMMAALGIVLWAIQPAPASAAVSDNEALVNEIMEEFPNIIRADLVRHIEEMELDPRLMAPDCTFPNFRGEDFWLHYYHHPNFTNCDNAVGETYFACIIRALQCDWTDNQRCLCWHGAHFICANDSNCMFGEECDPLECNPFP